MGSDPPRVSGRNRHHQQSAPTIRPRPARGACPRPRPLRALADQHVSRRVAGYRTDRPRGLRRRDRWRELPEPTSNRSWCRPYTPATSSSPTTSARTRSPVSSEPSQAAGPRSGICRPYSPDLNPIELCFAKLKALVRTARCRSTETLWPFLGEWAWHTSVRTNAANYFRHCGYGGATQS